jgi:hypothetical protein
LYSIGTAAQDPDLIFYMSFDHANGNTVADESGNGNTGTLKGDAEIVKDGKFGSALSVSGNGYVDCGNGDILNQDFPGLTIEAWIYPTVIEGIQHIISKWQWTVEGDHFAISLGDGLPGIVVADGLVAAMASVTGKSRVKENQWLHLAGTWDAETLEERVYVDAELDGKGPQDSCQGINLKSNENLKLGGQVTGTGRYFIGLIDEAAIYGRVLREDEIRKDMRGLAAVQPSGKVSTTWADIRY